MAALGLWVTNVRGSECASLPRRAGDGASPADQPAKISVMTTLSPTRESLFDAPEMFSTVDVRVEPVRGVSLTSDDWIAWIENDRVGAYGEARGYDAALAELQHSVNALLNAWDKTEPADRGVRAIITELRVAREHGCLAELLSARARLDWDGVRISSRDL